VRRGFVGQHKVGLASTAVVLAVVLILTAYALSSTGYPVHHTDLNDGGIWVTSGHDGEFARLNKPVGQLDGGLYLGGEPGVGHNLDVVQDGSAVLAWDRTSARLAAVDVAAMATVPGQPATVPTDAMVAMGGGFAGGTLAVLDKQTGHLWAVPIDVRDHVSDLTPLDRSSPPLNTKIGGSAALAVSQSGTIFVVSASGQLTTIRRSGAGFSQPQMVSIGALSSEPEVTTVGETPVVLDGQRLILPGRPAITLPSSGAVLQQSGPATPDVLLATPTSLLSVTLSDGKLVRVSNDGSGAAPAAPVQLGGCTFAAWTGSPAVFRNSCPSVNQTYLGHLTAASSTLVYRVNRDQLVLNDPSNGKVWNVDGANAQQVADWSTVAPPPKQDDANKHHNEAEGVSARSLPPKAVADGLGARPGRTTTLHVLDNDSDPAGNILAIDHLSRPDNSSVHLAISPDEQTVAVALPASVTAEVHFTYEINDGKGQHAEAAVTVTPALGGTNQAPRLCVCYKSKVWSVGASSVLSLPVMGDWRDPDGDPITLLSAAADAGSVSTTPDGDIVFAAPRTPPPAGVATLKYTVGDGFGGTATDSLSVKVIAVNSPTGAPPVAAPDVAMATVGQSVTIQPLDNDLPGADPASGDPQLVLAGPLAQQPGATVSTDLIHGTVTFSAATAKVYLLPYTVGYGAQTAAGTIRIDVQPSPRTAGGIIVMPDTAVLHAQQSVTVDVLANDYDLAGNVLVVQAAASQSVGSGLRVAIIAGHWLNVAATNQATASQPQLVRYTVTDGVSSATGEVAVTELPALTSADQPIAQSDQADVRAGDTVTIPVLDNDIDPAGAALSVVPASVQVNSGGGVAYVSGNLVRYVAPTSGSSAQAVSLSYAVTNGVSTANGSVDVTVHSLPANAAAIDSPPAPLPLVQRVVAGGILVIKVPTSGVDPDGDAVTLTGIDTPGPKLGQITAMTADSLTYRAFPFTDNAGTDTIGYRVIDRFGKVGAAVIRIGVVPPGEAQAPVAVNDVITGAPGSQLAVNVVANDFITPGTQATVAISGDTAGATVDERNKSVVRVTAPDRGRTTVVPYNVDNGSGHPATATLTVHSVAGFDNPPVARDDDAQPVSRTTTAAVVQALANDTDPDVADGLSVTRALSPGASVSGAKVSVPLTAVPQTIPYEIADNHGKKAMAVIFAPAAGAGAPYVKPGALISIAQGVSSKPLNINDYLVDPAHRTLITTVVSKQSAAPAGKLSVKATGATIVLTGAAGFVGPAAVTLQVTDGKTVSTPGAVTGYVTIPVQVGNPTAVLRCPSAASKTLYQGGAPQSFDISSVCNVWLPQGKSLDDVSFVVTMGRKANGVDLSVSGTGSRTVTLIPSGAARPGEQGSVDIKVQGSSLRQSVAFAVAAAPPMTLSPITVAGVKNNESKVVQIRQYLNSQFRTPDFKVLSCVKASGMAASCVTAGTSLTVRPSDAARGAIVFTLKVTDQPGDPARTVTGVLTLDVLGRPAAPASVGADANRTDGGQVRVSWPAPAYDGGAPIDYYEVKFTGGSSGVKNCPASPCVVSGLKNGTAYTFSVRSHNATGEFSLPPDPRSNPVKPDAKPDAVSGVTVASPVGDRTLTVSWPPARNIGSTITHYLVEISDVGTHTPGTTRITLGNTTTLVKTGLTNDDPYQFRVAAQNDDGIGAFSAPVRSQSAGKPAAVERPTVPAEQATAPSANVTVSVTWTAGSDPNGPALKSYTVYRAVGSRAGAVALPQCTAISATAATTCADQVPNDGKANFYAVTATNGAGRESDPVNFTEFDAVGVPDQVTSVVAAASAHPGTGPQTDTGPGYDGALQVSFTVPQPNGSTIQRMQYSLNGGDWTAFSGSSWPAGSAQTETIGGLVNGKAYSVAVRAGNEKNFGPASAASNTVYPYGPPPTPTGKATNEGNVVTYSWDGSTNGRSLHYWVSIDGGAAQDRGTEPGSESDDRGYAYPYSIQVYVVDSAGNENHSSPSSGGRTPDVSPPTGGSCGGSGLDVSYSWNGAGPGLTYEYSWNGGGWTGNGGSTSTTQRGSQYSTQYPIAVRATDGRGHYSSNDSFSCSTGPNPNPPVVSIAWAGTAPSSGCAGDTTCSYVVMSVSGFSPGTYQVQWFDDHPDNGQVWWTESISVGSNGTGSLGKAPGRWFGYGYNHYNVWAVVNGVRSNTIDSYGHK
jgi:hypothetical protein